MHLFLFSLFVNCNHEQGSEAVVKEKSVSVILLAGGKGKRMGVRHLSLSSILVAKEEFSIGSFEIGSFLGPNFYFSGIIDENFVIGD